MLISFGGHGCRPRRRPAGCPDRLVMKMVPVPLVVAHFGTVAQGSCRALTVMKSLKPMSLAFSTVVTTAQGRPSLTPQQSNNPADGR